MTRLRKVEGGSVFTTTARRQPNVLYGLADCQTVFIAHGLCRSPGTGWADLGSLVGCGLGRWLGDLGRRDRVFGLVVWLSRRYGRFGLDGVSSLGWWVRSSAARRSAMGGRPATRTACQTRVGRTAAGWWPGCAGAGGPQGAAEGWPRTPSARTPCRAARRGW